MSVKSQLEELVAYLAPLATAPGSPSQPAVIPRETWNGLARNLGDADAKLAEAVEHLEAATADARAARDAIAENDPRRQAERRRHANRARSLGTRVEATRDLRYDTEDLERRAKLLARRAGPAPSLTVAEEAELETARRRSQQAAAEAKQAEAIAELTRTITRTVDRANEEVYVGRLLELLEEARKRASTAPANPPAADVDRAVADELTRLSAEIRQALGRLGSGRTKRSSDQTSQGLAATALTSAQGTLETARSKLSDAGTLGGAAQSFYEELDLLAEMTLTNRRLLDQVSDE